MKNALHGRLVLSAVIMLMAMSLLPGCIAGRITGSGNLVSKTFDYTDFTKVSVGGGFQVELTESTTYSIKVTADDNLYESIRVNIYGDTLDIGLIPGIYGSTHLEATITMPSLHSLSLSGGSRANVNGFNSSSGFFAILSGGSQLSGSIEAGDVDFDLSGGSQLNLDGSADDMTMSSSGGSRAELGTFPVANAHVEISGGGGAIINAKSKLDVRLSGGSHVSYIGNPEISEPDLSGGSSINKQ